MSHPPNPFLMRLSFRITSTVSLLLPAAVTAQTAPNPAAVARLVDSLAQVFVSSRGAPSVAIGVSRAGNPVVMKAWGKADLEQDVAATPNTVYRIGSVTKQFTSAAVMQLMQQGKVRLDDSIATYLTALPAAWRGVTVRQLLNHTSGIPSYTSAGPRWVRRWGEAMTPDTLLALTASAPMRFAAGTKWEYDNTGYVLLGMIIEKVTGRAWGDDLEERFAKPLGLTDTRNCMGGPLVAHRAHGYEPDGNGWKNAAYLEMSQPYSAGAMCSTIGDLAKWNRALHTGKVVAAESYTLMTTPTGAAVGNRYGFGLGRDTVGGQLTISHNGGINGFITENGYVPGAEVSVTVLTNSGSASVARLRRQVTLAALGLPLEYPPKLLPISAAERARYVGVYALGQPGAARDFTIAEQGTELTAMLAGQSPNALLYYGNHTFGASFDPAVRIVFEVADGRATKLTLLQGGRTTEALRKP